MVNIQDSCCLDINFDNEGHAVHFGEDVYPNHTDSIRLQQLMPTLLNKSLSYPKIVYEEHRQVFKELDRNTMNSGVSFDLVSLPPGLLGIEYIKTHIYYSPEQKQKYSTVVEVHFGELTVIMQKNAPKDEFDFETSVEEGMLVKLHIGEKLAIPTGYYYTFINTEDDPVLFVKIYKNEGVLDYSFLKRERGLAYYCIRKNARQEIVQNPLYREVPPIREISANSFLEDFQLKIELSLYSQLVEQTESFTNCLWG